MAQQDRAIQRHRTILEAAAKVFDEKGFDAASIADIADEADTTKGGLYFHFASKEAVARAIVDSQESWLSAVEDVSDEPLQDLIDLSYAFSAALRDDALLRASIRLTIERGTFAQPDNTPYQLWNEIVSMRLRAAHEHGQLSIHWAPDRLAELITGTITGLQLASEVATGRADLDRRLAFFWDALLTGLVDETHLAGLRTGPLPAGERPLS